MSGFSYAERINIVARLRDVAILALLFIAILVLRLVHLQIIEGRHFRFLSEHNQFRRERLIAPRGLILDRNGDIVVDNRPAFTLSAVRAEMGDVDRTVSRLKQLLPKLDGPSIIERIDASKSAPYEHVVIEDDASFHQVALVEENSLTIPGIVTSVRPRRRYPLGIYAGNVLGYLGEVNEHEVETAPEIYSPRDLIGRAGIEQMYDKELRGENGGLLIEVFAQGRPQLDTDLFGRPVARRDSLGRPLRTLIERESVPGNNVTLTLDAGIQAAAEDALDGLDGSIVVMDARTGALIALVSSPSYDPTVFADRDAKAGIAVLTDKRHPMLHRAFQSSYAPGSTFKIIVAAAGLESGIISDQWTATCNGAYRIGNSRPFRCWKLSGHGTIDVRDALAYSCDVFFYALGYKMGIREIDKYAALFGLGQRTGLDLPGENRGFIPSPQWKRVRFAHAADPSERRWYPGETLNVAIGQGMVLATPLQMARVAAVIVNGGYLPTPYIAERITDADGQTIADLRPPLPKTQIISKATVAAIRDGLRKAVERDTYPTGTGHLAKIPGLVVIGKTGTAQVTSLHKSDDPLQQDIEYKLRDNSWFIGGVMDPEQPIAFAVMIEHGGHGGERAAPIAKKVIEFVYGIDKRPAEIDNRLRKYIKADYDQTTGQGAELE